MTNTFKGMSRLIVMGSVVLLFSGCGFWNSIKEKIGSAEKKETTSGTDTSTTAAADGNMTLLKINGQVELTQAEFDMYVGQILQSNQYFSNISKDALPAAVKRKIFDRILEQRLMVKKAKALDFENKEEFKKTFNQTVKLVESQLLVQMYEKDILEGITVSADEVQKEFDTNKDRYVKVAGGSLVEGVRFGSEQEANRFYEKAKVSPSKFASLAKLEKKADYSDFGRVSNDQRAAAGSNIPAVLKQAALESKKSSDVIKVADEDNSWVIHVSDKKDAVHFAFDEIKQQLEMLVKRNKFMTALEDRLKVLKNEFTIDVKEDFFATANEPMDQNTYIDKDGQKVTRIPVDQLPIKKIDTTTAQATTAAQAA